MCCRGPRCIGRTPSSATATRSAPAVTSLTWVLRTAADPLAATGHARAAIHAVDPSLGISDVATMEQVMSDSTSDRRLNLLLFALLGGLALALATVGVYGVVAYSVTQRTHEIGVRMAIGARPGDVVRMVLGEGGRLAVAGVAVGSVVAMAGARLIRGLLFEVSANDPLTFAGVAVGLLGVALARQLHPGAPGHARRSDDRAPRRVNGAEGWDAYLSETPAPMISSVAAASPGRCTRTPGLMT